MAQEIERRTYVTVSSRNVTEFKTVHPSAMCVAWPGAIIDPFELIYSVRISDLQSNREEQPCSTNF